MRQDALRPWKGRLDQDEKGTDAMWAPTTAATGLEALLSTLGHRQSHRCGVNFFDATTPRCSILKIN